MNDQGVSDARDELIRLVQEGALPKDIAADASKFIPKLMARESSCEKPNTIRGIRIEHLDESSPYHKRLVLEYGCDRRAWPGCDRCPSRVIWFFEPR